jgi:hypothetical protein
MHTFDLSEDLAYWFPCRELHVSDVRTIHLESMSPITSTVAPNGTRMDLFYVRLLLLVDF